MSTLSDLDDTSPGPIYPYIEEAHWLDPRQDEVGKLRLLVDALKADGRHADADLIQWLADDLEGGVLNLTWKRVVEVLLKGVG